MLIKLSLSVSRQKFELPKIQAVNLSIWDNQNCFQISLRFVQMVEWKEIRTK